MSLNLGNTLARRTSTWAWIGLFGLTVAIMGAGCIPIADECPDDANKTEPGICGCGVADTDTDGDGTPDCIDDCADDPDKTEAGDCGCGEADTDTDGDGVADCIDNCPDIANPGQEDACDLAVTITGPTTADGGDTIALTAVASRNDAPTTFEWVITSPLSVAGDATLVPADGMSQVLNVVLSDDAEGDVTFQVTVTDAFETVAAETTVTVTPAPPVADTTFTVSPFDNLTGTDGDDIFDAATGTLQSTDIGAGGLGADTLVAVLPAGTVGPELSGIESAMLSITGVAEFDMADVADMTDIAITTLTGGAFTLSNVPAIIDLSIARSDQDVTVTYAAAAVSGTADAMNVTAERVTGAPDVTIAGVETVNLSSTGSVANVFEFVAAALETLNITGATDVTMAAVPATLETLDASAATGDLDITLQDVGGEDVTVNTGAGDDVVTMADATTNLTADLGAGDDTLTPLGITVADDTLNGGDGDDTLSATQAVVTALAADLTNVTNFENLAVTDALNGDVALSTIFPGGINLVLEAGIAAGGHTITAISGTMIAIEGATAGADAIVVAGDGIADAIDLDLQGDVAVSLTLTGVEVATLLADTAALDIASLVMTPSDPAGPTIGTTALAISGDQDVDFSTSITVQVVDGSAMTGVLDINAATAAVDITGGAGDDALTGSAASDVIAGGDGDDVIDGAAADDDIDGGAGDDTITGGAGDDTLTGGDDTDIFTFGASLAANGEDVIADFTTDDSLDFNAAGSAGDVAATEADTAVGATVWADNDILVITSADGSTDTAAEVEALFAAGKPFEAPGANDAAIVIVQDTQADGDSLIFLCIETGGDANWDAGDCDLIATLTGFNTALVDDNIED